MRKQYTLAFKMKLINHFEKKGKKLAATSRAYIVDRKTIRSWIASKETIKHTILKTKRANLTSRINKGCLCETQTNLGISSLHQEDKAPPV